MKSISSPIYTIVDKAGQMFGITGVSILVYHSLRNDPKDFYAVSKSEFERQMAALSQHTTFLSLDAVVEALAKGKTLSGVVITFDDGYKSILTSVDTLKKYKIPATAFVLSNPNRANRKELDQDEPMLTEKDLKFLQKSGVTIGCHSDTHPDFSILSKAQIQKEVVNSKKTLEKTLDTAVKFFAYPKGRYTPEVLGAIQQAGYAAACTVSDACVTKFAGTFILPRMIVDKTYSSTHISSRISPGMQYVRRFV